MSWSTLSKGWPPGCIWYREASFLLHWDQKGRCCMGQTFVNGQMLWKRKSHIWGWGSFLGAKKQRQHAARDFKSTSTSSGKQITFSGWLLTCVFVDPNSWGLKNFHKTHCLPPALKALKSLCSSSLKCHPPSQWAHVTVCGTVDCVPLFKDKTQAAWQRGIS